MKSLAVISQKGGVGKTTLSLNLAFALARTGTRVLLIDCDPQGAVGHSLQGVAESGGLYGVLAGSCGPEDALVHTRLQEFSLLPVGEVPPDEWEQFHADLSDGTRLQSLLSELSGGSDLAVMDTPSGFCGATMGALRAADYAVSPLQAEPIALRTLPQLLSLVGSLRAAGSRVELVSLVLSMLQQRVGDSLSVAEEVWSRLPADLVSETTLPRDRAVLAAQAAGVPLGLMSRKRQPPMALVFERLAAELAPKFALLEEEDDGPVSLFA